VKLAGPRGSDTREILEAMGYSKEEIEGLLKNEIAE
jgi:crotonobetainyl-CoA:carnitine CoA-transferase CaiB-like acyl-CoA transferase